MKSRRALRALKCRRDHIPAALGRGEPQERQLARLEYPLQQLLVLQWLDRRILRQTHGQHLLLQVLRSAPLRSHGSHLFWTGVILYLLPLGAGNVKGDNFHGWSTPLASFWCCSGSNAESFGKLMDSIFFHRCPGFKCCCSLSQPDSYQSPLSSEHTILGPSILLYLQHICAPVCSRGCTTDYLEHMLRPCDAGSAICQPFSATQG